MCGRSGVERQLFPGPLANGPAGNGATTASAGRVFPFKERVHPFNGLLQRMDGAYRKSWELVKNPA